jgi:hypothetical protein
MLPAIGFNQTKAQEHADGDEGWAGWVDRKQSAEAIAQAGVALEIKAKIRRPEVPAHAQRQFDLVNDTKAQEQMPRQR